MKELKISELMNDYTDNELFLEGQQTVDAEKAIKAVTERISPKKKTKVKPLFKALIAVAAAAALTGAVSAAATAVHEVWVTYTVDGKAVSSEALKTYTFVDDGKIIDEDGNVLEIQEVDSDDIKILYDSDITADDYDVRIRYDGSLESNSEIDSDDIEIQYEGSLDDNVTYTVNGDVVSAEKTVTYNLENGKLVTEDGQELELKVVDEDSVTRVENEDGTVSIYIGD